jgi:hypothetical protein
VEGYCIDRQVLGTPQHLVRLGGESLWTDEVPSDLWHLSGACKEGTDMCLDTVLRLECHEVRILPAERFVRAMAQVTSSPIPWQQVLPPAEHTRFVDGIVSSLDEASAGTSTDYYKAIWVPGNKVMASLQQARIDRSYYRQVMMSDDGNKSVVGTFTQDDEGYARPPRYDRFATRTGRLTVPKGMGPDILTLKRAHRKRLFRSRFEGGRVASYDFAALEARILLYECGKGCDEVDLYAYLKKELYAGVDVSRDAIKGAIICELYGQSPKVLAKRLGVPDEVAWSFVTRIRSHFETDKVLRRVKQQFLECDYIRNRYGRRVKVDAPADHIFINHYAQSTGVDVAMYGFGELLNLLGDRVVPMFVLHDAILVDVPPHEVEPLQNEPVSVSAVGYTQPFPLKFELLAA